MIRTILHNLARGPQAGQTLHPVNLAKALFWTVLNPGIWLLVAFAAHH